MAAGMNTLVAETIGHALHNSIIACKKTVIQLLQANTVWRKRRSRPSLPILWALPLAFGRLLVLEKSEWLLIHGYVLTLKPGGCARVSVGGRAARALRCSAGASTEAKAALTRTEEEMTP